MDSNRTKKLPRFVYVDTPEILRQRQRDNQDFRDGMTVKLSARAAPPTRKLTKKQLAAHLKITERKLDGLLAEGLPIATRGGKGRGNSSTFDLEQVEDWLDANKDPIIRADDRDRARERYVLEKTLKSFGFLHDDISRAAVVGITFVIVAAMREFDGRPPLKDDDGAKADDYPLQLGIMRLGARQK